MKKKRKLLAFLLALTLVLSNQGIAFAQEPADSLEQENENDGTTVQEGDTELEKEEPKETEEDGEKSEGSKEETPTQPEEGKSEGENSVFGEDGEIGAAGENFAAAPVVFRATLTDPAAQIGDDSEKQYDTLQAAINAAEDGTETTIKLRKDLNENITIPQGKKITLDLQGHKLQNDTTTDNAAKATIYNKGTLTITDSSEGDAGTVDNVTHGKSAVYNEAGATCTILAGTFTRSAEAGQNANDNGGNSYYTILNHGTMTIGAKDGDNRITVSNNGKYSSAFENGWQNGNQNTGREESVLTIYGGTFTGGLNTIKNDDYGKLTIHGGNFETEAQYAIMNYNVTVIHDGTFSSKASCAVCNMYDNEIMDKGSLTINGGTFTAPSNYYVTFNSEGTVIINDGTFSSQYINNGNPDDYCPGHVPTQDNGATTWSLGELTAENAVVSVTSGSTTTYYNTLSGAIDKANEGDTVTLLKDITINSQIIDKGITLDLGGHTLSISGGSTDVYGLKFTSGSSVLKNGTVIDLHEQPVSSKDPQIAVIAQDCELTTSALTVQTYRYPTETGSYSYGIRVTHVGEEKGCLTLGDGTLVTDADIPTLDPGYETYGAVGVTIMTNNKVYKEGTAEASLTIQSGAKIDTVGFAVAGNGTYHNTEITINEGAVLTSAGTAIYHPQGGTLTINGGTITGGETGIEIRAGVLNMNGGSVTGLGTPVGVEANGNGTTSSGAGIAIAQHTTKLPISVNINDGSVSGYSAVYESNPQGNGNDDISKVKIDISDGNFAAINGGTCVVYSEDVTGFISGGWYTSKPLSDYIVPEKAAEFEINTADNTTYLYIIGQAPETPVPEVIVTYKEAEVTNNVTNAQIAQAFADAQTKISAVIDNADIGAVVAELMKDVDALKELRAEGLEKLKGNNSSSNLEEKDVYLHVQPYLDVQVTEVSSDASGTTLTLEASMKYNLLASTIESGELITDSSAGTVNAVILKSGQPLAVTKPVSLRLPIPEDFLGTGDSSDELIVKYSKDDTIYYYATTYDAANEVISFESSQGLSTFAIMLNRTVTVDYGTATGEKTYGLPDVNGALPTESKAGYTFKGWQFGGLGDTVYSGTLTNDLMLKLLELSSTEAIKATPVFAANASSGQSTSTSSSGSSHHSSGSSSSAKTVTAAKTGDSANVWLPVLLLLAAMAGIGGIAYTTSRRKKNSAQ